MVVSKRPKTSYGSKTSKPIPRIDGVSRRPKSKVSRTKSKSRSCGGMLKKTVVMSRTTKPKIVKVQIAVKPSKKPSRSKTSKTVKKGKGFTAGRMIPRIGKKRPSTMKRRTRIVRK